MYRRIVYQGLQSINDFTSILTIYPYLNTQILNYISNVFNPYWKDCIKYPKLFYKTFNILLFFNSLRLYLSIPILFINYKLL
jgi:hypothetical protein